MSKKRIIVFLMSFLIISVALVVTGNISYAEEVEEIIIDGEVTTWTESVDMITEKTSDGVVHIMCDTVENNIQYNYATVASIFKGAYETKPVYSEDYAAICIELTNKSAATFSISFILTDKDNNEIVCRTNVSYILENGKDRLVKTADFNSIPIEASFDGRIIIPLSEFVNGENNKADFDYKKLTSWTLGILIEGGQTADIYVNKLLWFGEEKIKSYGNSFGASILGPDSVQIPEHGESIAFFKIEGMNGNTYSFEIDGYEEGIKFDKDGKITLLTDVKEQYINIVAKDKDGFSIRKTVHLVKSWRTDNKDFPFYGPEELESITYAFDNIEKSDIEVVRIIIIVSCVVVFIGYIIFFFRYKVGKNKEGEE